MTRPDLLQQLAQASAAREQAGLRRRLQTIEHSDGVRVRVDGRQLTAFCSNDYLGLAHHPELIKALQKAAAAGVGSGAAHLVCGHHREHAALEEALADWTGRSRALLFSTGVMANLGVMQALLGRADKVSRRAAALCVQDRLNHASLIDGARAALCVLKRYPHADTEAATRQLRSAPDAAALLATDGVFSMDGDIAPLPVLADLCRHERATLMVDDAHGLGIHGPQGAGSLAAAGVSQRQAPVLMGTLGKALGTSGAFVAGSKELVDGLVQFARSYIYTTAMPPALAAATRTAVQLARGSSWRREQLAALIARFRQGAHQLDLPLMDSPTPIQPLLMGDAARATTIAGALRERGLLVTAIRPPTVPQGQARLRVTLSAAHTEADVDYLLQTLASTIASTP